MTLVANHVNANAAAGIAVCCAGAVTKALDAVGVDVFLDPFAGRLHGRLLIDFVAVFVGDAELQEKLERAGLSAAAAPRDELPSCLR